MKQNILSYLELEKIFKIKKTVNINKNMKFDFVRTLKYIDIPKRSSILYFPIYLNRYDDLGGWYLINSDTRKKIKEYSMEHPDYTYVLDEETYNNLNNDKIKVIIVEDIMESLDKLFNYIINNRTFETILVTGSVGKTTTVGLIKDVIGDNVLRIYSKRITPIILKTNIINYLTVDIKYLVLEAGLFFKHHVKYFSDTLKPFIGICLNILPEHIGIDGINSVEDITKYKLEIFRYSKYALINFEDNELSKLKFADNKMFYNDYQRESNVEKIYDISKLNSNINLYIKTYVSKLEFSSAYYVGKILNIPEKIILERLNNSVPVENRVNKNILLGREIIFDGEVSGVARFSLFTNHFYDKAVLIIRYLTLDGEEYEDYSKFSQYFNRFDKVYLFNDLKNLNDLKSDNVEIVSNHDFIKNIDKDTQIFYHYGSFYRKYDEFNIDNLDRLDI